MRPTTLLLTVLCCFFLCALPAPAQDLDNVSLSGRVTDETGALILDATVTAVLVSTNAARAVKTDAAGRYHLIELAPGAYNVKATSLGFAVAEQNGIVVDARRGRHVRALRRRGLLKQLHD